MPEPEVATVDTSGTFGRVMADTIGKELPGAIAESKAQGAEMRRLGTEAADRLERGQKKAEGLATPPPPPPAPPPQMQNTSVTEQWGSVAMGLAMLGSAFTRRPAINALNAAAGVMKAYQARDADEYKRNFERWKVETDYSLKMYQYQHDAYKDALDLIGKDQNTALAIMRTRAAALGDDPVKKLLEVGKLAEAEAILREREARIPKLEEESRRAKVEGQLTGEVLSATKALQENPTDPAAQERVRKAQQAVQAYDAATKASPAYGSNEQVMRDWHGEFVREHGREPTSAEETKQLGDLKKAESSKTELRPSQEIAVLDKDNNVVGRFAARESTTEAGKWLRSDDGKPVEMPPGGRIDVGHAANSQIIGSRESTLLQRQLGAGVQAVKAIKDVVMLPSSASGGYFAGRGQKDGLINAAKETLTNNVTSQEVQAYRALMPGMARSLAFIDSQGLQPGVKFSESFNAEMLSEGDKQWTKLLKLARQREIVEAGMETLMTNPRIAPEQRKKAEEIMHQLAEAVPWTPADVIGLMNQKNPRATLRQMGVEKTGGEDRPAAAAGKTPPTLTHVKEAIAAGAPRDAARKRFIELGGSGADFDKEVPP